MMSSGTHTSITYDPGEILLAKITFPDESPKHRPILVISKFSSTMFQPSSFTLICLAISSVDTDGPFKIKIKSNDLEGQPLPKSSQVVCDNIFTIMKSDVIKHIGKVNPVFYEKVMGLLKTKVL